MHITLEENFTANLTRQLRNNELDAVIVALPFELPGLSTWSLYDESFVVVMPQNHPWSARDAIHAHDLADEDLLLLGPGHCFRDQVLAACPGCRATDRADLPQSGSSLETIRHMVASGLGVTVLPRSSSPGWSEESRLLEARPFAGRAPTRRIAIAWRNSFPRPAAIHSLRNAVMGCQSVGVTLLGDAQAKDSPAAALSRSGS